MKIRNLLTLVLVTVLIAVVYPDSRLFLLAVILAAILIRLRKRLSKIGLFYAISGFPVLFKGYVGVFIHAFLLIVLGGLDYFLTMSNSSSELLRKLHHIIRGSSEVFTIVFNPALYFSTKFELHDFWYLTFAYPFVALILITYLRYRKREETEMELE